jgi:hypothetical protein
VGLQALYLFLPVSLQALHQLVKIDLMPVKLGPVALSRNLGKTRFFMVFRL